MSDTVPGIAEAFPETLHIFLRDQKMTFGDHVNHDPNDWRAYIRADAVQAQIAAAVQAERERCAKTAEAHGVYPELNLWNGGPEWYRHGQAIAAAIRKEKQP
jgi:hypothetical protein